MEETQTQKRADVCQRCLEPVPPKAARCPRCGEPIHRPANIRLILGVFGLVMFLAVVLLAIRLMQTSGARPAPPDGTDQQQTPGRPQTPPPPPRKPALGQ